MASAVNCQFEKNKKFRVDKRFDCLARFTEPPGLWCESSGIPFAKVMKKREIIAILLRLNCAFDNIKPLLIACVDPAETSSSTSPFLRGDSLQSAPVESRKF